MGTWKQRLCLAFAATLVSTTSVQSDVTADIMEIIIDEMGLYTAPPSSACRGTDVLLQSVCIPESTLRQFDERQIYTAVIALTAPERSNSWLEEQALRQQTRPEAYEVQVDDYSGGRFELVDGAILENRSSRHVGYIGYREDGILYNSGSGWVLCVNGRQHRVRIIESGSRSHHTRGGLRLSIDEIEAREECD